MRSERQKGEKESEAIFSYLMIISWNSLALDGEVTNWSDSIYFPQILLDKSCWLMNGMDKDYLEGLSNGWSNAEDLLYFRDL